MTELDFEKARFNMIEQQIRTWEVLDRRVLDVVASLPREDFVPERYRRLAYADLSLPIGHDQVMMPPKVEARMLQALDVQPADKVLEVGTGSGFVTACLARLGGHVHSVEILESFLGPARRRLEAHGITNVTLENGDAARGWSRHAPYDVIAVTGSLPEMEEAFKLQLAVGGRLFVIVGEEPVMEARLYTRVGEDAWSMDSLFETVVPPLINAPRPRRFVL